MTQFHDDGITITIQAASDAVMTQDNETNGTALADDDTRKMYGLPHTYSANRILYDNSRALVLEYFKGPLTDRHYGEGLEYVQSVFVRMQEELDQTLDMAFTVGPQHTAVKAAVKSSVDEVLDTITDGYFASDQE